jgi:hypothetical protein
MAPPRMQSKPRLDRHLGLCSRGYREEDLESGPKSLHISNQVLNGVRVIGQIKFSRPCCATALVRQ